MITELLLEFSTSAGNSQSPAWKALASAPAALSVPLPRAWPGLACCCPEAPLLGQDRSSLRLLPPGQCGVLHLVVLLGWSQNGAELNHTELPFCRLKHQILEISHHSTSYLGGFLKSK